jgi:hypothetical protein
MLLHREAVGCMLIIDFLYQDECAAVNKELKDEYWALKKELKDEITVEEHEVCLQK